MLRAFRNRAGSFVAIGWLFFLLSIPICLLVRASSGFNAFYFPADRAAPLNAFDIEASTLVLAAAAFAAATSSIALALKFRFVASAFVVAIWSVAIVGTQGARLFVKAGPEYFERHLGQQTFLVPWQYAPYGGKYENPYHTGFSVFLCLANLKGQYEHCDRAVQLSVMQTHQLELDPDIIFWRKHRSEMRSEPERDGYTSYIGTYALRSGGPPKYYVREDSGGQITRFVVCLDSADLCTHYALMGDYLLVYSAPFTEGGSKLDGNLDSLVESWRHE